MKIAIPSDDGKNITAHFGRCFYFVVFDIEAGKVINRVVRDNVCCPHRAGICPKTTGKKDEEFIKKHKESVLTELKDCNLVIGSFINPVLKKTLQGENIKYIVVDENIADEAIKKYLLGVLTPQKEGGSVCEKQSCNMSCMG